MTMTAEIKQALKIYEHDTKNKIQDCERYSAVNDLLEYQKSQTEKKAHEWHLAQIKAILELVND